MTSLQITHHTMYRYSGAVHFGRHRLVLRPREGHDLRVEQLQLRIEPAHDLAWTRDVFGNSVALVDFLAPADTLVVESNVLVRRELPFPRRGVHPPWAVPFPVVYDPLESVVAAAYRATSYQDDTSAVREFLERRKLLRAESAEGLLDQVNETLHREIKYSRRPEKGVQTPSQTLNLLAGSCRDVATLMMECCRVLGIAARFASGYLDCQAALAGHASTHAWVEAYLPALGWVGFDPTLGQRDSQKHIACGLSNHPRGVMPVSGTFTASHPARYLNLAVNVQIQKA